MPPGSTRKSCLVLLVLGGVTFACGCSGADSQRSAPVAPAAAPAQPAATAPAAAAPTGSAATTTPVSAEFEQLTRRAAELERALNATPAADVRAMLDMVARAEAPALSRELEKHLLRGDAGHPVLYEFFKQSDIEHDKIDALTHHPQLIHAILRIVALYPDETAAASRYLIRASKEQPESWVRRELFNFLPVFILHHAGRYPELRRDLEEDLVYQLQMGGKYINKISLALRDLNFQPPAEVFYPLLLEPKNYESHNALIEQLAARKEEGLKLLQRYCEEAKDFSTATTGAVLAAIQEIEAEQAARPGAPAAGRPGTVEKLLDHADPNLRRTAYLVYFELPRTPDELPRAIDFLNQTSIPLEQKRGFLSLLARKSREAFNLVADQASATVTDPAVKALIQRTVMALERSRLKKEQAAEERAKAGQGKAKGAETP